jgi:hypothetical protein
MVISTVANMSRSQPHRGRGKDLFAESGPKRQGQPAEQGHGRAHEVVCQCSSSTWVKMRVVMKVARLSLASSSPAEKGRREQRMRRSERVRLRTLDQWARIEAIGQVTHYQ